MEFLQETGERGYPTEYLLARIRGRRVFLTAEWQSPSPGPDRDLHFIPARYRDFMSKYSLAGIWYRYLKELRWIYFQMNRKVRHIFSPYFMYSELDTLLVCLRYSMGQGRKAETEGLLAHSLLSEKIKRVLRSGDEVSQILEVLRGKLPFLTEGPPNPSVYLQKNALTEVERWITASLLSYITRPGLHPVMGLYFNLMIDTKNILTLYKYLKWEIPSAPALFKGGSVPAALFDRIARSRDVSRLEELIYETTGLSGIEMKLSSGVEGLLYRNITRRLNKVEREGTDIGAILGHLWRFSREARNFTVLSFGRTVENDVLNMELVY